VLPITYMKAYKNKTASVKKSLSFPPELWAFVEKVAGPYGENSKVVQEAIRQMRDQLEKSGKSKIDKARGEIEGGNDK